MDDTTPPRGRGRPPGTKDVKPRAPKKTRERRTAERIATVNKTLPLDLMIARMMKLWRRGTEEDEREAIAVAEKAAPYIHAKLSSVEAKVTHEDLRQVREDLLIAELQVLASRLGPDAPPDVARLAHLASEPDEPRH